MALSWAARPPRGRTALVLCALLALLAAARAAQGRPSWRYVSSEVVVPRKEPRGGQGARGPGWLAYSLRFAGRRHVLHLRRKRLLQPRHLALLTQDDQGALQMDFPFLPADCHYLGYLQDVPLSTATVDTCHGGLRGIMKLDDLTFEVQPLQGSPAFEHVVSQLVADANATGPTYRLGEQARGGPPPSGAAAGGGVRPRLSSRNFASHAGSVRGLLIGSKSLYDMNHNISLTIQFLVQMGSLMDSLQQGLDFRYIISTLLVHNQGDPVSLEPFHYTQSPYAQYYQRSLYPLLHPDSASLFSLNRPNELEYTMAAYQVCKQANLLMLAHQHRHILLLAVLASQQLSKSMGVWHDEEDQCKCQRRTTCVMYRYPVLTDSYSNCSFLHIQNILSNPQELGCLFAAGGATLHNRSLTHERCGNGLLEAAEQCDCGSFKQCYSNSCCRSDCRYTPGSACNAGRCCTECKFSAAGTLCRPMLSACDLPEYCRGNAHTCPRDVHMQDGTPCTQDSYCYRGNCTDRDVHCMELFGQHARDAPDACYQINTRGTRYGHCTRAAEALKHQPCAQADVRCGRLQCVNVTHLPRLQEHVGFHQTLVGDTLCFGLDEHRGTATTDVGHVRDGARCSRELFCQASRCSQRLARIHYDCPPLKCSLRGVCNNNRNCHCHVGWDPPSCLHAGVGGSADSGPPPHKFRSVRLSRKPLVLLRVVFLRLYLLTAAVLFGVATNVRRIVSRKVREAAKDEAKAKADEAKAGQQAQAKPERKS